MKHIALLLISLGFVAQRTESQIIPVLRGATNIQGENNLDSLLIPDEEDSALFSLGQNIPTLSSPQNLRTTAIAPTNGATGVTGMFPQTAQNQGVGPNEASTRMNIGGFPSNTGFPFNGMPAFTGGVPGIPGFTGGTSGFNNGFPGFTGGVPGIPGFTGGNPGFPNNIPGINTGGSTTGTFPGAFPNPFQGGTFPGMFSGPTNGGPNGGQFPFPGVNLPGSNFPGSTNGGALPFPGMTFPGGPNNGVNIPTVEETDLIKVGGFVRSHDGSGINFNFPQWGSSNTDQDRLCPANYQDGFSRINTNLPNAREVSNRVGVAEKELDDPRRLSHLTVIWGQFITHDLSFSVQNGSQPVQIPIPRCDKFMDTRCTGNQSLKFRRTVFNSGRNVRTPSNVNTAWMDASQVYGSSNSVAQSLRTFRDGKLKLTQNNTLVTNGRGGYLAGDVRANENVALTALHTIFARQHNRIAERAKLQSPALSDEKLYQIARNYVIGLIQHITFQEYLPAVLGKSKVNELIGRHIFDPTANPTILTEFSTAAFRFGHVNIRSPFQLMTNIGLLVDELDLSQMFIVVTSEQIDQVLNGATRQHMKRWEIPFTHQMRNFIFSNGGKQSKVDLLAFDIMRNRDHGLGTVNCARQKVNLPPITSFSQTIDNPQHAKELESLYGNIDNLDLILAIFGEKSVSGGVVGQLGARLIAQQFKNIRNGDRLWFENAYPNSIIDEIKGTSLRDVLNRNSGANIHAKAFVN